MMKKFILAFLFFNTVVFAETFDKPNSTGRTNIDLNEISDAKVYGAIDWSGWRVGGPIYPNVDLTANTSYRIWFSIRADNKAPVLEAMKALEVRSNQSCELFANIDFDEQTYSFPEPHYRRNLNINLKNKEELDYLNNTYYGYFELRCNVEIKVKN